MVCRAIGAIAAVVLAIPAGAAAQDPSWQLIRPNATWASGWIVQPRTRALNSVLDEPLYLGDRPVLSTDRASATRRGQRFAIGFNDVEAGTERLAGGQMWIYIGIRKGTRVDVSVRARRAGRVVTLSSRNRITPPVTVAPEEPPVGRNGFRGWLPVSIPSLPADEANRLSLAVRISPSSRTDSLSRVYAAFAELYP